MSDALPVLSEVLSVAADAMVLVDDDQRIVLFSRGAEEVFGHRAEEVLGRGLEILLPEDVRGVHRQYVHRFAHDPVGSRWMGERGAIRGLRKTGRTFPAEASISRLTIDGRRFFLAVLRDTSERDRAREDLLRSQRRLAEAQRLAGVGSFEWDLGRDSVSWSDELRRIYGVGPDEVPAGYAAFLERVHPDDRASTRAAVQRALDTRGPFEAEHRILRSDGAVRLVQSRGEVVLDPNGKPLRLVGSCQDVTERHEAEERERALLVEQAAREAAEAAAERSRFLAEASVLLASSLDVEETLRSLARLAVPRFADWCAVDLATEGSRLRRVVVAHPDPETERLAREAYDRYPPDPARPDPIAELVRGGRPRLVPEIGEGLLEATAQDAEHLALLRRLAPRSAIGVPLVARGRTLGAISFITAESGRRYGPHELDVAVSLAERAALAVDNARLLREAQRAARAREEAVAVVSHDLRNPLGLVRLNLDLLRDPTLSADERERGLARASRAVEGMRRLVADLLDVTRLEGGRVALHREDVDLGALFADACDLVAPAAAARGVCIEREAPPGAAAPADRDRLLQVLGNLLDNAIRFSPEGGRVRLCAEAREGAILFRVVDEGPGIPPELRERVFERFWQAGSPRREGSGLGLAIARHLVALHGGTIWIARTRERGTTLCFTIPTADPERS